MSINLFLVCLLLVIFIGQLMIITVLMDGGGIWARWRQYRRIAVLRRQVEEHAEKIGQIKAPVLKIGSLVVQATRLGVVTGVILLGEWEFDHSAGAIPMRVGADGLPRFMGWTPAELHEIYCRRKEWAACEQ